MAEPPDAHGVPSNAAEPGAGGDEQGVTADDGFIDGELADDGLVLEPAPHPTVETTSVGYPSHYLDPPPETVTWA